MSTGDIPVGTIYPQVLSKTILDGYPNVLVDDINYLVNDTRALIGSQTTPVKDIKMKVIVTTPKSDIQQQR